MEERVDASITFGAVALTRTAQGWTVEVTGPVDLAQLEAVLQWAKHAPPQETDAAPPVEILGVTGMAVSEAHDLLVERGGFGAASDIVASMGGGDEVQTVRYEVSHMAPDALAEKCEAVCADDADVPAFEMALEERVGRLLNGAVFTLDIVGEQLQRVSFYHGASGIEARNLAIGVVLKDAEHPERETQHAKILDDVEYFDDVRVFLGTRRTAKDVGRTFLPWPVWHAERAAQRDAWQTMRDEEEENIEDVESPLA